MPPVFLRGTPGFALVRAAQSENPPQWPTVRLSGQACRPGQDPVTGPGRAGALRQRLERGTFRRPAAAGARVGLSPAELAMPLEGFDPAGARRRKRLTTNKYNMLT